MQTKLETNNGIIGLKEEYTGDFTGDNRKDVAIYYSLEATDGGNYQTGQGLALYENTGDNIRFITNYMTDYIFSFNEINSGYIYIKKEIYTDDDPRCCPSSYIPIEISVRNNKIIEKEVSDDE